MTYNIFDLLKSDVIEATYKVYDNRNELELTQIETPKNPLNGDLSTNVAMIVAAKRGLNARELALKYKDLIKETIPYVVHVEVAGPGFINITLRADKWHECLSNIINSTDNELYPQLGKGEKVNLEYVSANPTGPMHIGHARCAVYGDALANLLIKTGFNVTKEYYVNDAGTQVNDLVRSTFLRYEEAITNTSATIPEGLYPGEYLIPVGKKLAEQYGDSLLKMPEKEKHQLIKNCVIDEMLIIIKNDLDDLGINHDLFFSEQSLHDNNKIPEAVDLLKQKSLIYNGTLPPPKGKTDEQWHERPQLLFRSSKYGDESDRPIKKSNDEWSYLAADLAYAKDKIDRDFKHLIYVLGADHSGYVKRIEAVVKAFGEDKVDVSIKICQLVNFVVNQQQIKMSKRSGNFTTVRDVINAVGKDIIRFMMLTRKNDIVFDFDLELVKQNSKDNPVFYVQYAHVRALSILQNAKEQTKIAYEKFTNNQYDLTLLSTEEEIQLIKLLSSWQQVINSSVRTFEPHKIVFFLINLAAKFHAIWNLGKENNDFKFIVTEDNELTAARLVIVQTVQKIIKNGLEVIGVKPLDKM